MSDRRTRDVEMSYYRKGLLIVDKWPFHGKALLQLKNKEKENISSCLDTKEEPMRIVNSDASELAPQEKDLNDEAGYLGNDDDDMGNILSCIIQYLQEEVMKFKNRKATLEKMVCSSTDKLLQLNATISECEERRRKLDKELEETNMKKYKVIHILMNTTHSVEEECKLECIRHELEKKSILVQFDVYAVRLGAYLEYEQYYKEINNVESELIQVHEDLASTEAVLQQCILADLEVKDKEKFVQ